MKETNLTRHDFYYDLPEELIAQDPLEDRSSSRLLVLDKNNGDIEHTVFSNIKKYLKSGDCLVLNNTKVIPARLVGEKISENSVRGRGTKAEQDETHGASIELLLLKRRDNDIWETLVKPGKKARVGAKIKFGDGLLIGEIVDVIDDGNRLVKFSYQGIFEEVLDRLGEMPLPPYITHRLEDKNRYQTVYAKYEGSAAAPTAGLHFTNELLKDIEELGVKIVYVTLHVGLGTFRPVKVDNILEHHMHSEFYVVSDEVADAINETKKNGGRVIGVGTTSCRTIESVTDDNGIVHGGSGDTSIFIYPGYRFRVLDALITNFHLPESTLMMLVSALAGREHIMKAYEEAVKEGYRFFSFGDAMLITTN
ncbi:MAG TPA: tRNA preQ1(34) S-adenosylmethionine ribosyltransferase-isomerase QueA [Clostridiales bacterium]|nr:tRNA preQ1(34) S-adenosylmethionine ribosyltransferase-isomerase QueA [Clostridiales bacterium]